MNADLTTLLGRLDLLQGFRPEELTRLAELGRIEHWRAGAVVIEEGTHGPRMMVLITGRVSILRRAGSGAEHQLAELGPGECVGEMSLLLEQPRTATVRAATDLTAFAMDRQAFTERAAAEDPVALKLGLALSRALARRLRALNERVVELLARDQVSASRVREAQAVVFPLDYE